MDMPSFILPANGKATPKSLERRRKMAESLMASGMDTSPIASPWQGAARMAQALVGGMSQRRADQEEAAGQQSARDAMTKALMGGSNADMLDAVNNPWMDNASLQLVTDAYNRQFSQQNPKLIEAGGSLYDPSTGEWITPPPKPQTADARAKLGLSPQYGVDAQGNPVLLQIGDDGAAVQTQMPEGITLSKEPIKLDAGTHFVLLDPITRQPVGQIPKDLAGAEKQKEMGAAAGKATAAAPADIQAADIAIDLIDKIAVDPNMDWGVGMTSVGNQIPGTPGYDFQNIVDQAKSGAFLSAIQQMRGMGSLSNAEGDAATKAVTRLNTATSKEAFLDALNDYRQIVQMGRERAMARLNGSGQPVQPVPQQQPAPTPQKRLRYNPNTGELE